ncbi:unnamed protein product [Phaeothamnion confervicola]
MGYMVSGWPSSAGMAGGSSAGFSAAAGGGVGYLPGTEHLMYAHMGGLVHPALQAQQQSVALSAGSMQQAYPWAYATYTAPPQWGVDASAPQLPGSVPPQQQSPQQQQQQTTTPQQQQQQQLLLQQQMLQQQQQQAAAAAAAAAAANQPGMAQYYNGLQGLNYYGGAPSFYNYGGGMGQDQSALMMQMAGQARYAGMAGLQMSQPGQQQQPPLSPASTEASAAAGTAGEGVSGNGTAEQNGGGGEDDVAQQASRLQMPGQQQGQHASSPSRQRLQPHAPSPSRFGAPKPEDGEKELQAEAVAAAVAAQNMSRSLPGPPLASMRPMVNAYPSSERVAFGQPPMKREKATAS